MLFRFMKMLLASAPGVRRMTTRLAYEAMSRFYSGHDVPFLNFGYASLDGDGKTLKLDPGDEENRFFIQLYSQVVAGAMGKGPSTVSSARSPSGPALEGLDVLEIGCGRGGGAAWIARNLGPKRLVATDISPSAVAHANRRYGTGIRYGRSSHTTTGRRPAAPAEHRPLANLSFVPADAEALPFPDGSFDVVLNVESSHCYGSMDRFLSEVARVLRRGGRFCFCDVRDTHQADALRSVLSSGRHGLRLLEIEDITANVLSALDRTHAMKEAALARFPFWVRGMFRDQSGMVGGIVHTAFLRGERVYLRALLER